MRMITYAAMLSLLVAGYPAHADKDHDGHGKEVQHQEEATHAGQGKVVSVDRNAGTVKIAHGPIESLNWKSMTMDFKAHDPAMLNDLKPGMAVKFDLMKMGGGYHVMKIALAPN